MGGALLDSAPAFAQAILECEQALTPFVDWSLTDVMRQADGAPSLERIDVVQPTLMAMSLGLAELAQTYGLTPAATLGYCVGEVVAAHVAGALSLEDAARVASLWSQAQGTLTGLGEMASVAAPRRTVLEHLERSSLGVSIAAHVGPGVTIVAGARGAIEQTVEELQARGLRARKVGVGVANHTAQIDRVRDRLLSDLGPLSPCRPRIPCYLGHLGAQLADLELDAGYWASSLRHVVKFEEATRAALAEPHRVLIEFSPHPVLTVAMQNTCDELGAGRVLSTLRRQDDDLHRFFGVLAEAWTAGVEIRWQAAFADAVGDAEFAADEVIRIATDDLPLSAGPEEVRRFERD
jgi:candicidin polyketide synthase FscB